MPFTGVTIYLLAQYTQQQDNIADAGNEEQVSETGHGT
jgi:hypothetical protein